MPAPSIVDLKARGLYTTREAAEYLGVDRRYVDRLVTLGHLHPVKIGSANPRGGWRFFRLKELTAYRNSHPNLGMRRAG